MSRIHPSLEKNTDNHEALDPLPIKISSSPKQTTLTVWKRSSMSFHGTDGFTVYDQHGRLAFRVDNYSRKNGWSCSNNEGRRYGEGDAALVLMDGSGKPLLKLKPQTFSFQRQWSGCIYKEDHNVSSKKDRTIFVMRRPSTPFLLTGRTRKHQVQCEAEVFFNHQPEPELSEQSSRISSRQPDYKVDGSFWNRNCKIRSTTSGELAAKIIRKRTGTPAMASGGGTLVLSEEVFSLVVNPGFDPQLIMAFVVILDRICFKPIFTPFMCS